MKFDDSFPVNYSVTLDQMYYYKDLSFDGYSYEELFKLYIEDNLSHLSNDIQYDSENGMVCLYTKEEETAEELAYELSKVYKTKEFLKYRIDI